MTVKRSQEELSILWMMLDHEFLQLKPESHEEVAKQVVDLILWKERIRNGLETNDADQQKSDLDTITALSRMDTNDPDLVLIEKIFWQLANARGADAMRLLQTEIENQRQRINERQRQIAKASRPKSKHPLSIMVDTVVEKNLTISQQELYKELLKTCRTDPDSLCQYDTNKNQFIPNETKFPPKLKSDLSDYLYRAKRRIIRANRLE